MNPKIYSNINNYLIIYTPKVIPWGQMDKQTNKWTNGQTDGQIFTQYSGISSHSLRGVRILNHDLVCENPVATKFVSDMEMEMQNIEEKFNTTILTISGSRNVRIMSFVFSCSTIRRSQLLRRDSRAMQDRIVYQV